MHLFCLKNSVSFIKQLIKAMNIFFLVVELISYVFALFLFFKKKDLAIIYIPALIFSNNIVESSFSASIYYGTISILILSCYF